MKKYKTLIFSALIVFVMIICSCCGSSKDTEETSGQPETTETSETTAKAHSEREDHDNGEYTIRNYDEQGALVQSTTYSADDTVLKDISFDPEVERRAIKSYALNYTVNTGYKNESWVEYLYSSDSPLVTVKWKKISYVQNSDSTPSGEYLGTGQVEYEMQNPNNRIQFSLSISKFDKENFLIVPEEYSITEYAQNEQVASEQFKYEDKQADEKPDSQEADGTVLKGNVSTISYDEAVELQGYPDYNEADHGQTWVIVTLDSPQRLKGTQDVDTWEKEYSVILVWTQKSSGSTYGENTLSDYIGKHITFTAGSFSLASDTSVPIGVPWAHDITVIDAE